MGIKITDLTALATAPNTADVIAIVDVSDTTQALSGTTKKITIADLGFLSSGDNITELTNNAGYITSSDFSNGGELAGANRDLGNTDAFALSFITNGVGRINIEAGGNVGIGTSTPSQKLEVVGNTKVTSGNIELTQNISTISLHTDNVTAGVGNGISARNNGSFQGMSYSSYNGVHWFGTDEFGSTAVGTVIDSRRGILRRFAEIESDITGLTLKVQTNDVSDRLLVQTRDAAHTTYIDRFSILGGAANPVAYFENISGLGIGTTTPTEKLEVVGGVNVNANVTNQFYINPTDTFVGINTTTRLDTKFNLDMLSVKGNIATNDGLVLTDPTTPANNYTAYLYNPNILSRGSRLHMGRFTDDLGGVTMNLSNDFRGGLIEWAEEDTASSQAFLGTFNAVNGFPSFELFGFGIQTTNKDVAINTQGGVGTSAMIIKKSNGNIGMGTMTPTEKLEVVGNIKASLGGNISTTGNSTSTQLTVGGNSSSAIKARINGNVGNGSGQANGLFLDALPNAGTTSYYQINSSVSTLVPSTLVSVYGSARNGSSVTVGVQGVISGGMGQASSNFTAAIRGENTANLGNTHYGGYFTNNTSVIGATVYGVRGQIATVAANQTRYGSYFDVSGSGTNTLNIGLYATATGATNNYAAIFDAGNVGIGTTTPTNKLEVVGNTDSTTYSVNGTAGANFSGAVTNITVVDGIVTAVS